MGLLKEVTNEQARAKIAAFGEQGSGKTTTLALIAIGLSKTYHNSAPVACMDTENGADFLKPIFAAEGVKFLAIKSGAFKDMVPALREAQESGCCAFIMDSVTHTWKELVESYCARKAAMLKRASYDPNWLVDAKPIKEEWARWTHAFLNSNIHCLVAGRAGMVWEQVYNEDKGKMEPTAVGTKMKSEGEFGYEPNLLFEMEAVRVETNGRKKGGYFNHKINVLKDRARFLNGKSFECKDINVYKVGDYKKVFAFFEPHLKFLNIGGTQKAISSETSEDLFDGNGNTEARKYMQSKKIALEEIENLMGVVLWPGTNTDMKRIKLAVMQALWGVRSWSAVEGMPLRNIENGLWALHEFEKAAIDAQPEGEGILKLVGECIAKVAKPGYAPGRATEEDDENDFPGAQSVTSTSDAVDKAAAK